MFIQIKVHIMENLNINDGGFRYDNTDGYSQEQLDQFNIELDRRLQGVESLDEYQFICKSFADEVARR